MGPGLGFLFWEPYVIHLGHRRCGGVDLNKNVLVTIRFQVIKNILQHAYQAYSYIAVLQTYVAVCATASVIQIHELWKSNKSTVHIYWKSFGVSQIKLVVLSTMRDALSTGKLPLSAFQSLLLLLMYCLNQNLMSTRLYKLLISLMFINLLALMGYTLKFYMKRKM